MPTTYRPCSTPGCPELTTETRCPQHQRETQNTNRARTPRNNYGPDWKAIRRRQLRAHPTCETCTQPATVVDHRTPLRYFSTTSAAHTPSNLASLCKPCHDRKTVTEDGGFGRAPSPRPPTT